MSFLFVDGVDYYSLSVIWEHRVALAILYFNIFIGLVPGTIVTDKGGKPIALK